MILITNWASEKSFFNIFVGENLYKYFFMLDFLRYSTPTRKILLFYFILYFVHVHWFIHELDILFHSFHSFHSTIQVTIYFYALILSLCLFVSKLLLFSVQMSKIHWSIDILPKDAKSVHWLTEQMSRKRRTKWEKKRHRKKEKKKAMNV